MLNDENKQESTGVICAKLCISFTSAMTADNLERRARKAHKKGRHDIEASLLREAAKENHMAGNHYREKMDRQQANQADQNHCCRIL